MIPRIADIRRATCETFALTNSDLVNGRLRKFAHPRQIAMYLCRELTDHSLPVIGRHFGGRHHTTVMHAVQVIEQRVGSETAEREEIRRVQARLGAMLNEPCGDGVSGD